MDDLKRWQSLSQLCKDMLDLSLKSEDLARLVLLLVGQLESDYTSMKMSNGRRQQEEIFSLHQEVLEQ